MDLIEFYLMVFIPLSLFGIALAILKNRQDSVGMPKLA